MISVAIVEDHLEYGLVLKQIINSIENFETVGLYSSAEAALAGLLSSDIDMVIVDMRLPGISGIELIKKLKGTLPHTQYLVCSTHYDNDTVFEALKAGASGYILKDSTAVQIQTAVQELHQGGAPMSPYIARKIVTAFHEPVKETDTLLTKREKEVIGLVAQGIPYDEIADLLFLSPETVKTHIKNIYSKLHVRNKVEAINKYKQL